MAEAIGAHDVAAFHGCEGRSVDQQHVLTIDVDWAPDWMVEYVADILMQARVRATWFVTHGSPAFRSLEGCDLFEIGIHPNCLLGSTHGTDEDAVLTHMKTLVPNATSMRTHALYQSSPFLTKAATEYGIGIDVSLFLPRTPHLVPHRIRWHGADLWRIPYFWEDDSEMSEVDPIWSFADPRLHVDGLKVFDFHPVHIVMNTVTFPAYEALKGLRPLSRWDLEFVRSHIQRGRGPQTLFLELVDHLSAGGGAWVSDLVSHEVS